MGLKCRGKGSIVRTDNMRYKKDKFTYILREAGAAGLSYGHYVAQQLGNLTPRKPTPKDHISLNDRKRLKIGMPIYCGKSTLAAAFPLDCPRKAEAIIGAAVEKVKARREQEAERSFRDEVIFMYLSGCKLSEIQSKLRQPRSVIVETLRGADIGLRGRPPLPQETIARMEALRADGLFYKEIAKECGVTEKTVEFYLSGGEEIT